MNLSFKNREFKIWRYGVSHSKLLIRSPKNREHDTTIDIQFYGVEYINIPNKFKNIEISSLSKDYDNNIIEFCKQNNL